MRFHSQTRREAHPDDSGYILLTLLLAMALMVIFAGVIVPSITFDIKRDREEEMIHRGVQYSRAIRGYYKKFGRYPTKIEDLESANNLRFLRKRYKDPLNCKSSKCEDFKLLHFGEVQLSLSGIAGGTIPGANPTGPNGGGGLNGERLAPAPSRSLPLSAETVGWGRTPIRRSVRINRRRAIRRQDRIHRSRDRRRLRMGQGTARRRIRQEPGREIPDSISLAPAKLSADRS
jgi:type II secretory pathway pseudopilin PulG